MILRQPRLTPHEEAILAAAEWSDHFRRGGRAQPIPSPIPLPPGEHLFAHGSVRAFQYTALTIPYQRARLLAVGGLGFLAGAAIGAAVLNRRRRLQLEALAAPQWRLVDAGTFYLTNARLALDCTQGWADIWLPSLRDSQLDVVGLTLWPDDIAPTRLATPADLWLFVLLRHLAGAEPAAVHIPGALATKARRLGRHVPESAPPSPTA